MVRKISALCGVLVFLTYTSANALVFSDTEFLDSDWSVTTVFANNGAFGTQGQSLSGGNGGAYRHMTHTLTAGVGLTRVFFFHQQAGAVYDASVSGSIGTIDYSEDQLQLSPPHSGAAIGARMALEQGGVVYVGPSLTYNHAGSGNWVTASASGLTATDFFDILEAAPALGGSGAIINPDFSAGGTPIQFGYVRENCCGGDLLLTHGIDNWSVSITAIEVSSPSDLMAIFCLGLFGLAAVRLRTARI